MSDEPSFTLSARAGGGHHFQAVDQASGDLINIVLGDEDRRTLGLALADALTALDAPGLDAATAVVKVGGRRLRIMPSAESGLRFGLEA